MQIGFDVDGVFADFTTSAKKVMSGVTGKNLVQEGAPTDWYWTCWDITKQDWDMFWRVVDGTENFWLTLPAYKNSIWSLKTFLQRHSDQQFDITFITQRGNTVGCSPKLQTEAWFRKLGFTSDRFENATFAVEVVQSYRDKAFIINDKKIEFYVDDKPETVRHIRKHSVVDAMLLKRVWNQDAWDKVPTINSLRQYFKRVSGSLPG